MLITTTNVVEDRHIRQYLGVVAGEAIMGAVIRYGMLMVTAAGAAVKLE